MATSSGVHPWGALAPRLATAWLIVSLVAGMWLITGVKAGPVRLYATTPSLASKATANSYGGDAYTGIQNAAADTEQAVVAGTNGLADFSQQLAESNASFNRDLANKTQRGLGIIIIGIGVLTFTVAVTRRG